MTVTVVIACHNHATFLGEAMESVVAQTYPATELVVVDDGSTDRSLAVAESVVAARPEARIEVVSQPASGHPAHARNRGVAVARGELIACLDPYDRLAPDFLERCAAALETNPERGFAYTDQLDFGSACAHHTVPEYDFETLTRDNFLGVVGLFRRSAWEAAGGFDASIPYDDWDFWIGCGDAGRHGIRVSGTTWHHRVRTNGRYHGDALPEIRRTRAMLVRKRPHLYSAGTQTWAEVVLARDGADAKPLRSFATLAFAEELVAEPALLDAYSSAFGPGDDATLVICSEGDGLVPLLAGRGLDGPDAPDIRTVPARARSTAAVASSASALLSRTFRNSELAGLPRYDDGTIAVLRAEAERSWLNGAEPGTCGPQSAFVSQGELVFHVGAGDGELTAALAGLGARVVAIEPDARRAERLRERFGGRAAVELVEQVVGSWEASHESAWAQPALVQMTTLARLIELHGAPVLCRVDTSHFTDHVVAGLDRPLPCVVFRVTRETLREGRLAAWRLAALGMSEFNVALGGAQACAWESWKGTRSLYAALDDLERADFGSADVYARPRA